ncbi:MAG: MgtC/SapB family protein [Candidatus Paceibacterota bacterium]
MELATIDILIRLVIALLLGALVGVERTLAGKNAGMRTYALVAMGSALFVLVSQIVSLQFITLTNFDPLRLASQVLVGIGFIGAGLVFHNNKDMKTSGLTSAAGLWVSAGIGMSAGFGLYSLAIIAALLTLLIFTILWYVEKLFKKISYSDEKVEKENSERLHE